MRKTVCTILALIILLATASPSLAHEGEILFRDVPWGSNIPDTYAILDDFDFVNYTDDLYIADWCGKQSVDVSMVDNAIHRIAYPVDENFVVAGYKVVSVSLVFLYGIDEEEIQRNEENVRLYNACYHFNVADAESAYADLQTKLSELYGVGEPDSYSIIWYGESNTGVCLSLENDYLSICYGMTDENLISELHDALVHEEQTNALNNSDGL